ncbi:MAG: hypothetical protein AAFY26_17235 [Cyanobacteria bacterium J06638_22]
MPGFTGYALDLRTEQKISPTLKSLILDANFRWCGHRITQSQEFYQIRLNSRKTQPLFAPAAVQRVQTMVGFFNRI